MGSHFADINILGYDFCSVFNVAIAPNRNEETVDLFFGWGAKWEKPSLSYKVVIGVCGGCQLYIYAGVVFHFANEIERVSGAGTRLLMIPDQEALNKFEALYDA